MASQMKENIAKYVMVDRTPSLLGPLSYASLRDEPTQRVRAHTHRYQRNRVSEGSHFTAQIF